MIESMKKWSIERPDEKNVQMLVENLGISSVQAKILTSRGITTVEEAKSFVEIDETAVHDPFLFYQMDLAVERIKHVIDKNEQIVIYGDYDAGATRF